MPPVIADRSIGPVLAEQIFDLREGGLTRRGGLSGGGLATKSTTLAEQVFEGDLRLSGVSR